jgi:hypothetical protein
MAGPYWGGGMTQPTDGATQPAVPPVTIAFDLGWQMISLHDALPVRPPAERDLPDRPRNASQLSVPDKFQLVLDAVQFSVAQLARGVDWPKPVPAPDAAAVEDAWTAFTKPKTTPLTPSTAKDDPPPVHSGDRSHVTPAEHLKQAVSNLNDDLLIQLSGADTRLGNAYSLGHALANTCAPGQANEDVWDNFEPHRIGNIYAWLTDLATAFPDHSAKAVAQSLTWWRDTVWVDGTQTTSTEISKGLATTAPGLIGRPTPTTKRRSLRGKKQPVPLADFVTVSPPDLRPQAAALRRQGELWRAVLAGTKNPLDLLDPDDYISAAQRSLRNTARLARMAVASAWPFLVLSAFVALLIVYGLISHPSGGTTTGGVLVVIGGYVLTGWKVVSPRLAPIATKLETFLLNAELDLAIATAVTLPPAGRPDPSGWTASQTT